MMSYSYNFSGSGLIWMLLFGALIVVPFWRLLPQYRIPGWVSLVAILPFAALILLWVMAFRNRVAGDPT